MARKMILYTPMDVYLSMLLSLSDIWSIMKMKKTESMQPKLNSTWIEVSSFLSFAVALTIPEQTCQMMILKIMKFISDFQAQSTNLNHAFLIGSQIALSIFKNYSQTI